MESQHIKFTWENDRLMLVCCTDATRSWTRVYTQAGHDRRLGCQCHCVGAKFGGGNISIATLLFPRRLQLSCTRKILETFTCFVLYFTRQIHKKFTGLGGCCGRASLLPDRKLLLILESWFNDIIYFLFYTVGVPVFHWQITDSIYYIYTGALG